MPAGNQPEYSGRGEARGRDRIFKASGAQAIAAFAYGTETIPRVDKIVGPGNAYVAEAKRQVSGLAAVDMIAGPSEILIIADGTCNPEFVAADMLSQAEHDAYASAVLITDSAALAEKVRDALERQLPLLPRYEIARASIDNNGKIIVASSLDQAIAISNELAPEHLELCVDNPFEYLDAVRNAGSVFLGKYCPEALGDYYAPCPNHTSSRRLGRRGFPARCPLTISSRSHRTPILHAGSSGKVQNDIACFAGKEGLEAHARSVTIRFEKGS
jgi:histidinol dehydrogenase